MDNSKVLKPIIGPQESEASKKKEGNKKKKSLIISALAFLISVGTIGTSIAIVKANMPKLEIKFDQWFVDSFDFDSMQAFIDENRLSKGDIDKKLPGYVDKKAKDQNVKNADMITNARLTNKIPESNKLPHGIYVEMTAEVDYAFTFQADLSLEDNNENTKELSSIADEPKKPTYFINKDKSKLYVLVYERESDSDESLPDDLQTFNDFKISNCPIAFQKLNDYIAERNRRYTSKEFEENNNWEKGLEIFCKALIGLESQYILQDQVSFDYDDAGQRVMKIKLDNRRSNFEFTDQNDTNGDVTYDESTGTITIKNIQFFSETELCLTTLQDKIQKYIEAYDATTNEGRYTRDEFQSKMGDEALRQLIATQLGVGKEVTLPDPEPEIPENPDSGDTEGTNPLADTSTPPNTTIDHSKIKNIYLNSDNNLVIDLNCDEKEKYTASADYDKDKYTFDQVNDRVIVKGLKYYTEINITNTDDAFNNLDAEIVKTVNQYTVSEFKSYAEGETTQQDCKNLIAKGLRANGKTFDPTLITKLTVNKLENSETKANLIIEFDNDFKKYKTDQNEQFKVDSSTSTMSIPLTFFKKVEMNNLKNDIQTFINEDTGPQYTKDEFKDNINSTESNQLKENITNYVTASIVGATNVENFKYDSDTNELTFHVTIRKYEKFPESGDDIKYELVKKNADDTTTYKVTITNLEYWFDFVVSDEQLKLAKKRVSDFIFDNAVCSSDDDENNYPDFKEKIFNLFGETKLENGMPLSRFMTYNDNDFKLEQHSNFIINLKPKADKEPKLREFKPISLPETDGIDLDTANEVLTFKNIEFVSLDKYFVINRKENEIWGVSELGKEQTTLNFPKKYTTIKPVVGEYTLDNKTQQSFGFKNLNNLVKAVLPSNIENIQCGSSSNNYFMYECKQLKEFIFSSKLKKFKGSYYFSYCNSLTTFDFSWFDTGTINSFPSNSFWYTKIKNVLLPRKVTTVGGSIFVGDNTKQTAELRLVITWLNQYNGGNIVAWQEKLKAFCIIADSVTIANSNIFEYAGGNSTKFYVKNETVKNQLISNKVSSSKITVCSNLEQELIQAGKIPHDW